MRVFSHTPKAQGVRALAWMGVGLLLALGASCRSSHEVTVTRRADSTTNPGWPKGKPPFRSVQLAALKVTVPAVANAELINDDELCMTCHETYVKSFQHNVHRQQKCEECHGPGSEHVRTRGKEPGLILSFSKLTPPQRSELCLKCHEQSQCSPGCSWRTSLHAHKGVACTNCHTSHYNVPPGTPSTTVPGADEAGRLPRPTVDLASYLKQEAPPSQEELRRTSAHLGAIEPNVCYRCHANMQQLARVAHPHQIGGVHGFSCSTCHNPHGQIKPETRQDLCLSCHQQTPTTAWHSSTHAQMGVACTDCHNPHPTSSVQPIVDISHTAVRRPPRLPMSVDDPNVCYKCHQKIFAEFALPSHHPLKEGKMACADCHDPHGQNLVSDGRGQALNNLKGASVNLLCYKCHAEKQGPFVFEHPPVTENCDICHTPHGAVTNNLLRQPTTFLCLRCHTGHRKDNRNPDLTIFAGNPGGVPATLPHPTGLVLRAGQYTDCTQCHSQVHGSDIPSNSGRGTFFR